MSLESISFNVGRAKLIFKSFLLLISTVISLIGGFIKTGGLFGTYKISLYFTGASPPMKKLYPVSTIA
jgi:hypothetical protein